MPLKSLHVARTHNTSFLHSRQWHNDAHRVVLSREHQPSTVASGALTRHMSRLRNSIIVVVRVDLSDLYCLQDLMLSQVMRSKTIYFLKSFLQKMQKKNAQCAL